MTFFTVNKNKDELSFYDYFNSLIIKNKLNKTIGINPH